MTEQHQILWQLQYIGPPLHGLLDGLRQHEWFLTSEAAESRAATLEEAGATSITMREVEVAHSADKDYTCETCLGDWRECGCYDDERCTCTEACEDPCKGQCGVSRWVPGLPFGTVAGITGLIPRRSNA